MKKFIVPWKSAKKNMGQTALNAAVRGAGGVAGAFGLHTLKEKLGDPADPSKNATLIKHRGILAFVLGTAGDVFFEQPQAKAACQGLAVAGFMQEGISLVGADLAPKISLQGIEASGSSSSNNNINYDKLAEAAEQEANAAAAANKINATDDVIDTSVSGPENIDAATLI